MTQVSPSSLHTANFNQIGIQSALWLLPKHDREVLTNLPTASVYYETIIWHYRQ